MSEALRTWQENFFAAVRGDDASLALAGLDRSGRVPPETGLAIYRNAYRARLVEALDSDHAQLGRYLGDALWQRMCDGYIAAHPSRVRSLRHFGEHLPAFLERTSPFAEQPQLAALARWERHLLDTFDAADGTRADSDGLAAIDPAQWPTLALRLHPSVQPFASEWNVVPIWQALKAEQAPPAAARRPDRWLVWRDREQVTRFRALPAPEARALDDALAGRTLAELCEGQLAHFPADEVPAQVLTWLRAWADEGCVGAWHAGAAGISLAAAPSAAPRSDR